MVARGWKSGAWCAVLFLWLGGLPAGAADYYLNDGSKDGDVPLPGCPAMTIGSDVTACGSCERPCLTPDFAYRTLPLKPGDTVHLNAGVYGHPVDDDGRPLPGPLLALDLPTKSGTPEAWLTFTGPVDDRGRPRRDSEGRVLARIVGVPRETQWIIVSVDGIRLRALAVEQYWPEAEGCDVAPIQIPAAAPVTSFLFESLEVSDLRGNCTNGVRVEGAGTTCKLCAIRDSSFSNAPYSGPAISLEGLSNVEVAGNTIQAWSLSSTGFEGISLMEVRDAHVHHNVIRDGSGPGIVAVFSPGLLVEHNTLRHNNQRGTPGTDMRAELTLSGGDRLVIRNNILEPLPGWPALGLAIAKPATSYNGYVLAPGMPLVTDFLEDFTTGDLAEWQTYSGGEQGSQVVRDAAFVSDSDLHLRSTGGHWSADGSWIRDEDTSPFLDAADPDSDFSQERTPNGGRANLGAYGNTPEASRSPGPMLTVLTGDGQRGIVGERLAEPLVVLLQHPDGLTLPSGTVRYTVVEGEGRFDAPVQALADDGRALAQFTPDSSGSIAIEVQLEGRPEVAPVRFTVTAEVPDGGEPLVPVRPDYRVSCGCTQGGAMGPLGALLLLAAWSRLRRRPLH